MANKANTGETRKLEDFYPLPFVTEGAEVDIKYLDSGQAEITFRVAREALAPVLERWTWNEARVTITAGDRDIAINYPAIKENVTKA